MITNQCPDRETLFAYSVGRLADEQSDEIATHLSSCPDCQAEIQTLDDRGDTFMTRLRAPLDNSCLDEPQLGAAVAEVLAKAGRPERADGSATPGPKILGEYRLLEELGRGGMGRVYLALHTKLDRVVALKILPKSRLEDPRAMARFEREMKAIGRLNHPNIVHATDAREIDGQPVLIMEYIEGFDLAELVRRLGRLPVAEACELVRQAALGLQYAHEHGLVHRDVKPSNLMLSRSGELKLLDLGLARLRAELPSGGEMTDTGQAMGTADYMAPEQATDSRSVDIRADLYSLGCTLYKLLSGRAPFASPEYRGTFDKMTAHVQEPIPPIRQLAPDVPDGLSAILDRLLAKDPEERFSTPSEAATALEPFCAGADLAGLAARAAEATSASVDVAVAEDRPAQPSHEAIPQPAVPPRWRRPWLVLTAVGLLLLGGVGGVLLGVMITIKRGGQEPHVTVPDGAKVNVDGAGNAEVTLPGVAATEGASVTVPGTAASDEQAIQGTWDLVSMKDSGRNPQEGGKRDISARLVFTDGRLTMTATERGKTEVIDGSYTLDPSQRPKAIDLFFGKGGMNPGIYGLEADRLTIVFNENTTDGKRPTAFVSEPRSPNDVLMVLRRVADASKPSERGAISLQEAVRVFNARAAQDPVGKNQTPLTEDEVIAAVRWALLNPEQLPVSDETLQLLSKTIDSRQLSPGFDLEVLTGFEPTDRMAFTKWSVRLVVPRVPEGTFGISIREVMINSRLFGEEERKVIEKWRKKEQEQGGLGSVERAAYEKEREKAAQADRAEQTPAAPPSVDVEASLEALQGAWKVVRVGQGKGADRTWADIVNYGSPLDPATMDRFDFVRAGQFDGDWTDRDDQAHLSIRSLTDPRLADVHFRYRIDPTAKPQTIDLLRWFSHPNRAATLDVAAVGIYKLDGERLEICLRRYTRSLPENAQRPKDFAVGPDSESILFVCERYRPSEAVKALQGTWTVVTHLEDGNPVEGNDHRECSFDDPIVRIPYGESNLGGPATTLFALDATKTPMEITFSTPYNLGEFRAEKFEFSGIYQLEGDKLQIAYRKDGPRPTSFESTPGSGVTLLMLMRQVAKPQGEERDAAAGKTCPVTAQVLVDGKPAEGVAVGFHKLNADSQTPVERHDVTTDQDGRFKLSLPQGEYRMTFGWAAKDASQTPDAAVVDKLGGSYAHPETSPFRLSVAEQPVDMGRLELQLPAYPQTPAAAPAQKDE